jgi:hypothetical protein
MSQVIARLTLSVPEEERQELVEHLRKRLPASRGWKVEGRYAAAIVVKSMGANYLANGSVDLVAVVSDTVAREGLHDWPKKLLGKTLVSTRWVG